MLAGRIGALAFARQSSRAKSSLLWAAVGTGGVVGGATVTSLCQDSELVTPWRPNDELLVPTLEATFRALRLVKTASQIVMDYELAKYMPATKSFISQDGKVEALQEEMEHREKVLEKCQMKYASEETDPSLSSSARKAVKAQQKKTMQEAASRLAEVEEELVSMEGESSKSRLHRKAATRLLELCRKNGGVYVKVGQHLANLDYIMPQEYIEVMSTLFDEAPQSSYQDVRHVIESDLGAKVEDLFDGFEVEPIASASLAQVHVAYDKKTGKKLAVKVQHSGLRETSVGDIFAVTKVVQFIDSWFEDFTFGWIADEIAPHLPKELDFTLEGKNSERAAVNLTNSGLACVVPEVIWTKSTSRVLTMTFEEGFKATDEDAISQSGLCKSDIAKLISSVFNSQVFLSAWVHCDPHPANVLLRSKNGRPEMVLVDHGLYKEIDDKFRIRYAQLWRSLMMADLKGIEQACKGMGITEAYPLFAAMLTARPYDEIIERSKTGSFSSPGASPESQADKAVIRGYAKQFLGDIFVLLGTLPPQMLLLLKMNDCLRHIDFALGSPTNTLVIAGKYASRAVHEYDQANKSIMIRWTSWLNYMTVMFRIQVYELGIWMTSLTGR